jgi:hypothetical protein
VALKRKRDWVALLTCSAVGAARGQAIRIELPAGLWLEVVERVTSQTLTPDSSPLSTRARGEREFEKSCGLRGTIG